jgi:hypothetical protein
VDGALGAAAAVLLVVAIRSLTQASFVVATAGTLLGGLAIAAVVMRLVLGLS